MMCQAVHYGVSVETCAQWSADDVWCSWRIIHSFPQHHTKQ